MSAAERLLRLHGALEAQLARSLPAFLPNQRWFGGKARRIASVGLEDSVWLREGDEPAALGIARVEFASGTPERYVLMLALRREPGVGPSLGILDPGSGSRHVTEASGSAPDVLALLRHLDHHHQIAGVNGGALRFGDLPASGAGALDPKGLGDDGVRALGAEQSNTSLRVGAGHVFKLFRRIEAGENPEVEIGRFLENRTRFRAVPALRGSVTWQPAAGTPGTVGALQDLVENEGDGWQWTLRRLDDIVSRGAAPEALAGEFLALGAVTAELHAALASGAEVPGFAPRPAGSADAEAWEGAFRSRAARVFELLAGGAGAAGAKTRAACETLLRLRPRLEAAADLPPTTGTAGFLKIRLHGDYHLGQVLKTRTGFVVIDFEGEPARSLAERKQLHCALKDVSGMLRSFDYAADTARARAPGGGGREPEPPPMRDSFLAGYQARALELGAPFLPSDPHVLRRWTTFFELDKALYEVEYEIQNRPPWLHVPVRGMLRLLGETAP